jgi:hypothetical protein
LRIPEGAFDLPEIECPHCGEMVPDVVRWYGKPTISIKFPPIEEMSRQLLEGLERAERGEL